METMISYKRISKWTLKSEVEEEKKTKKQKEWNEYTKATITKQLCSNVQDSMGSGVSIKHNRIKTKDYE
jgi:hypothetical protein